MMLCGWALVQTVIDRGHGRGDATIALAIGPCFAVALALVLLFQQPGLMRYGQQVSSLRLGLGLAALLAVVSRLRWPWPVRRGVAALAFALLAAALALAVVTFWPGLVAQFLGDARRLLPGASARTVAEIQPLFELGGRFDPNRPWSIFSTPFYLALPACLALAWRAVRRAEPHASLALTWYLAMLVATVGQNRFGYYLAVALALPAGAACAAVVSFGRARGRAFAWAARLALLAALAPAALLAIRQARGHAGLPQGWHRALTWLRQASPEPFGDPGFYLRRYSVTEGFSLPEYTVMAWWDYGHWITRVARRVPLANPTQAGAENAAQFLLEGDPARALARLDESRARYVLVDDELLFRSAAADRLEGKFETLVQWAGERRERYYAAFEERGPGGEWRPVFLFFPAYFRSASVRLYLYRGAAAEPQDGQAVVVTFREQPVEGGLRREILDARPFPTHAEAAAHLASLGPGPHLIASRDPLKTCVPLEAFDGLRVVHETTDADIRPLGMPSVRVFERAVATGSPAGDGTPRSPADPR
jgi:dolichyl-diphosphooligosaccharide--protein glycosyltransferase